MSIPAQYFRTACEECHTRKVRCKPSPDQGRGGTTQCEACRVNGRKCLFSLKSKTGRPRNTTVTTVPKFDSINLPSPLRSPPPLSSFSGSSNATLDSPSHDSSEYFYLELPPWPSSNNDPRNQLPLNFTTNSEQGSSNAFSEGQDVAVVACRGCSDGTWQLPKVTSPTQNVLSATSACNDDLAASSWNDIWASVLPGDPRAQSTLSFYDQSAVGTMSRTPASTKTSPPCVDCASKRINELPTLEYPFPFTMRKPETISDIVRTIELCNQVREYEHAIPGKIISLLSTNDASEVHELLGSLEKLCSKIYSIVPQQSQAGQIRDQPTFIMVFTAVMQAIEQTVDRLGSIVEFEQACQAEDSPMMSNSMVTVVPQLQIERLLSMTRLDFYLLQMKSFITLFDTSLELLAAAESILRPAESSARLLSYHRCLESILEQWKKEWRK
ncbi:Zn2/Cys6 DNA-binding protein [Glarea lozoyensis ATCC 20868]|uniref:Zn2/Cys6 DNA-binding protein n=1 Tax=Glarea lozoyensis (strain ATCC 20868 / MF5171) TaxID=1116229 RepID=S3D469_GLAL2|nr:Zn2/Cys6 DNA-binding protein [Glarea lozoyensis ATCC 20868]EPE31909.1 Zn2/Cys6 DNA-binding protein [Glarea lozoyensis ATCC 20868]